MAHSKDETLTVAWCDNGLVHGRFTDSIITTIMSSQIHGVEIIGTIRSGGNQIARQRQIVFDKWDSHKMSDWLLWVDSDVIITPQILKKMWDAADKSTRPVVTGIYFVSMTPEASLMTPLPAIWNNHPDDPNLLYPVHPLPKDEIIKVDCAGFGLVLMHKSIIKPIREVSGEYSVFAETSKPGDKFISEDIMFFKKLQSVNIPLHAHTGAIAQHMKTFSFDENYYNVYWNSLESGIIQRKEE